VLRDCREGDAKRGRKLRDGMRALGQAVENRPPRGITKGVKQAGDLDGACFCQASSVKRIGSGPRPVSKASSSYWLPASALDQPHDPVHQHVPALFAHLCGIGPGALEERTLMGAHQIGAAFRGQQLERDQ
jgi:hypothetical protein